jgi:hypothetical protein
MRDRSPPVSGSNIKIDAERRGKLLYQKHRIEREGTVKEATRAQKPAFDSSSITRRRNGTTPYRN